MKRICKKQNHRGIALIATLIFIGVFMAVTVGMITMSSHNAAASSNLQTSNLARSTAESGLEVVRYWLQQLPASSGNIYGDMLDGLETMLFNADVDYTRTLHDDGIETMRIGPVSFDQTENRLFEALIKPEYDTPDVDITITVKGTIQSQSNQLSRAMLVGYKAESETVASPYNWWDFGVASKGPLSLKSLEIDAVEDVNGIDVKVGADAYIESSTTNDALSINNAQISGNVKIVNPDATVDWSGGQSSIGGEGDEDLALANHVEVGVSPVEFPVPNPQHFEQYLDSVSGLIIDSGNKDSYKTNVTLENVRIAANTNPQFTGNIIIKGVMYIEQPNEVVFGGNTEITGVIIGNGDVTDNSGVNTIDFQGTVSSSSVTQLPSDSQFDGIRNETGTFLMAPGFAVSFGGNFGTLNGCIIANGVKTYGNAGGTIAGSILNFSNEPMLLEGKDLLFRKSGIANVPPHLQTQGITYWSFKYNSTAYKEGSDLWSENEQ